MMTRKNGTKHATTTTPPPHDFQERPTSLDGQTETACVGCGVLVGAQTSDECPVANLGETAPKRAPVEVLAKAMGVAAQEAAELDAVMLAANGVRPDAALLGEAAQPRLPLPVAPFDSEKALERIFSKRHAVTAAKLTWEKKQAQAREAKSELESVQEELEDLLAEFESHKRAFEASMQPRLVLAKDRPDTFAHIAGEPGDRVQACTRCGVVLVSALDAGGAPYVVGTEIGEDCEPAETTDAPEAGESLATA